MPFWLCREENEEPAAKRGNKEGVEFKEAKVEEQEVMVSEHTSYDITCGNSPMFR